MRSEDIVGFQALLNKLTSRQKELERLEQERSTISVQVQLNFELIMELAMGTFEILANTLGIATSRDTEENLTEVRWTMIAIIAGLDHQIAELWKLVDN